MRCAPAKFAAIIIVHVEQLDGAPSDRSQSDDPILFHREVFVPTLRARMKQRDELTVDVRGQVRSLVKIAPMARETKIGLVVRAAMLFRNNVFDVERDERQLVLMAAAVFTAVLRTVADETAKSGVDRHTINSKRRR